MNIVKSIVIVLLLSFLTAQNVKISGTIRDINSKETLPFANVMIKGTDTGTSADSDGKFEIPGIKGDNILLVSYIGYKTEEIKIKSESDKHLNIYLTSTNVLLQEITVLASGEDKKNTNLTSSLEGKQIESVTSSTLPDIFRSIQSLPGIAVNNEASAKFNVRGGNFDENLIIVNNSQVYEPFHLKMANNASIGIFNKELMKKVNLIAGGFSAKYGDRLSSVLDIEYREGNREKFGGVIAISPINLEGVIEGPIGNLGSFIIGAKQSYLQYALALLDESDKIKLSFYDVQGVFSFPFSSYFKTNIKFIRSGDNYKYEPEYRNQYDRTYSGRIWNDPVVATEKRSEFDEAKSDYYNNLLDIQNNIIFSGNAFVNTSLSYYEQNDDEYSLDQDYYKLTTDKQYYFNSSHTGLFKNKLKIKTYDANISAELKITPYYDIKAGAGYQNIKYDQNYLNQNITTVKENIQKYPEKRDIIYDYSEAKEPQIKNISTHKLNGYIENIIQAGENLIINAGLRYDYFDMNKDTKFSPRISASYLFPQGYRIRAAWGHYYQAPIYRQLAYSEASDTNTKSQKAEHYILGLEKNYVWGNNNSTKLFMKIEGYYKKYSDLIESKPDNKGNIIYSRKNDSKGYATGMDLMVSLSNEWYSGWVSYGLLFSKEQNIKKNESEVSRYTDQRHTLSLVNSFLLGNKWGLDVNFTYGSGFAFTPKYVMYNETTRQNEWREGVKNSEFLPAYTRLDIKISKTFSLLGTRATAFFELSNALNSKNLVGYEYRFDDSGNPIKKEIKLFPMMPGLGIRMEI